MEIIHEPYTAGEWIISRIGGQIVVKFFYTTLISVDLGQHENFRATVCDFRQMWSGGISVLYTMAG